MIPILNNLILVPECHSFQSIWPLSLQRNDKNTMVRKKFNFECERSSDYIFPILICTLARKD
uniref:Uncharacterized protein n=1 Tax=Rhizophora mucronata TaxID=61149 RepID=A0A2P2Q5Z4_RHIMU